MFCPEQVREGDKLVVSGETISIDSSGVLGGVARWLSSQGRSQTSSWLSRFSSDLCHFVQLLSAGIASAEDEGDEEGAARTGRAGEGAASRGYDMGRADMMRTVAWEMGPCIQVIPQLAGSTHPNLLANGRHRMITPEGFIRVGGPLLTDKLYCGSPLACPRVSAA